MSAFSVALRTVTLTTLVIVAGSAVGAGRAEACHESWVFPAAGAGTLTVAAAVPMTVHDLVVEDSSHGYAVAETLVMGLLTVVDGALLVKSFGTCSENGPYPLATADEQKAIGALFVWSAALTAHGIYELATERETPVMPTVVSDGEHVGGGVAWIGRF